MNSLKAQGVLWVDDKNQKHYSLKFQGIVCLTEEFQPREVIEEYEFWALYLRSLQISESVCGISEC